MGSAPFDVRGAMEGFYGTYYTAPERNDLIRFLGQNGFNFYLYGPKNDRQHRMRWWVPYPRAVLDDFEQSIGLGQAVGVRFCYAISFGVPLHYASSDDFDLVTRKLRAFFDRGCRAFGVLLDDMGVEFAHLESRRVFRSMAAAQADLCNRLLAWLRSLDPSCTLCLCPTEYHGRAPFGGYLHDLGTALEAAVDVFYTGPGICSRQITRADAAGFAEAVGRPPLIWDNYPVNDLAQRWELHVGPLLGRDPLLYQTARGFVSNLMGQMEASKIALRTVAEYLGDPQGYDPAAAWRRALAQLGEESSEPLGSFAENSLRSCLYDDEAPQMDRLVWAALKSLRRGEGVGDSKAVRRLSRYLDALDESCYQLKYRMRNLALRRELLPWIEALEDRVWLGRRAITCLQEIDEGTDDAENVRLLEEQLAEIKRNARRIGGAGLLSLAEYARERGMAGPQTALESADGLAEAGSRPSVARRGRPPKSGPRSAEIA